LQVQQAKDTLSEERHDHQDSQQALESSQQLLAAASGEQQQLMAQVADLQLQLQGSTAEHSDLQVAISAADAKLSASEADLAGTHSQVGFLHFCVFQHTTNSPLQLYSKQGQRVYKFEALHYNGVTTSHLCWPKIGMAQVHICVS